MINVQLSGTGEGIHIDNTSTPVRRYDRQKKLTCLGSNEMYKTNRNFNPTRNPLSIENGCRKQFQTSDNETSDSFLPRCIPKVYSPSVPKVELYHKIVSKDSSVLKFYDSKNKIKATSIFKDQRREPR